MRTLVALAAVLAFAPPAQAAGTVEITGGFTRVEADTSIHCTQQEGDGDNDELQAGPEDFEAEVSAASHGRGSRRGLRHARVGVRGARTRWCPTSATASP